MVVRCAILKCRSGWKTTKPGFKRHNNAQDSKMHVFRFPKNKTLRDLWIQAAGKKMTSVDAAYAGNCQKHFQPDDISNAAARIDKSFRARLKPKAVPSIFDVRCEGQ